MIRQSLRTSRLEIQLYKLDQWGEKHCFIYRTVSILIALFVSTGTQPGHLRDNADFIEEAGHWIWDLGSGFNSGSYWIAHYPVWVLMDMKV